jgi:hypothetical protein
MARSNHGCVTLRNALTLLALAAFLATAAFALAVMRGDRAYGIAGLWQTIAGPPDLGPVDFASISRSTSGNDALFCPPGLCAASRPDGVSPVFAATVQRLRDAIRVIEVNDPDLFFLARDDSVPQDRYLARTPLLRYPDTINVRFHDLGQGRASLSVYSRSQIGRSDFGVNRARVEAWLAELARTLPVAQP